MGSFGKRGSVGAWKKGTNVRVSSAREVRDEVADIELAARKWAEVAVRVGWCSGCGGRVDEANGILHDEHCIPADPSRCQKGKVTR